MPEFHLEYLSRAAYISSTASILDPSSIKFAQTSLAWWDERSKWKSQGCMALCDVDNKHLCYIFFTLDHFRMYLSIHNFFTPLVLRRKGYAHALLDRLFKLALEKKMTRFKLSSISISLDFYLALGFVYWGVNSVGDYYCDLPMPLDGLGTLAAMIANSDTPTLLGRSAVKIHEKTDGNVLKLSTLQLATYEIDKLKMGKHYMLHLLNDIAAKK